MVISKKHYKLDEAAKRLGPKYSVEDVIYLGAYESLPIYVVAVDWDVEVSIRHLTDDDEQQRIEGPAPKFVFSDRLNGLTPLHAETLRKFEAAPEIRLQRFLVERKDDEGNSPIYQYCLIGKAGIAQQNGFTINLRDLVITAKDLAEFQKPSSFQTESPDSTKAPSTLLKLAIGMAVAGYKYDPKAKKGTAIPEICSDLENLGIGIDDDTIRKWLKEGLKYLPSTPEKN